MKHRDQSSLRLLRTARQDSAAPKRDARMMSNNPRRLMSEYNASGIGVSKPNVPFQLVGSANPPTMDTEVPRFKVHHAGHGQVEEGERILSRIFSLRITRQWHASISSSFLARRDT